MFDTLRQYTQSLADKLCGEGTYSSDFLLIMFVLLIFFFVVDALFEKLHPPFFHVTGASLILGIAFSLSFYFIHGEDYNDYKLFQFRPDVFFDFILPPIVFNAGFNMKRKKFFENLGNIAITGIGVTFVCFFFYTAATYWFIQAF